MKKINKHKQQFLKTGMPQNLHRRQFLQFLGRGSVGLTFLSACSHGVQSLTNPASIPATHSKSLSSGLPHLAVTTKNDLILAPGLNYHIIVSHGDLINKKGELFGSHNDFIGYLPFDKKNPDEGYFWVNHEYFDPRAISGYSGSAAKTLQQVQLEQKVVGGSLLHIKKDQQSQQWQIQNTSSINARWDAQTWIPYAGKQQVLGQSRSLGTLGNCCGGITPWGTFLTCEENYHQFYGEVEYSQEGQRVIKKSKHPMAWDQVAPQDPEHYGWVVEIDPRTQKAQKHISLGRFAHEGATVVQAKNGCAVVYMGDDKADEFFYKFVASRPGQLVEGTLYVAQLETGRWLALDVNQNKDLKKKFVDQTQLLIRVREAARFLGATPLDRPEDCEVDPITGAVYLNCTNNSKQNRPHGVIYKFVEKNNNYLGTEFSARPFLKGGDETGFSSPDNMAFDAKGNMWMVTDMPVDDEETQDYKPFGNNSLFYIPMSGDYYGQCFRLASAPKGAELTGIAFAPDQETLFCAVQHPTHEWPYGPGGQARSSVVAIQGPLLKRLLSL